MDTLQLYVILVNKQSLPSTVAVTIKNTGTLTPVAAYGFDAVHYLHQLTTPTSGEFVYNSATDSYTVSVTLNATSANLIIATCGTNPSISEGVSQTSSNTQSATNSAGTNSATSSAQSESGQNSNGQNSDVISNGDSVDHENGASRNLIGLWSTLILTAVYYVLHI